MEASMRSFVMENKATNRSPASVSLHKIRASVTANTLTAWPNSAASDPRGVEYQSLPKQTMLHLLSLSASHLLAEAHLAHRTPPPRWLTSWRSLPQMLQVRILVEFLQQVLQLLSHGVA